MGKVLGFLEIERRDRSYGPIEKRVKDYKEFIEPLPDSVTRDQAARCMDCGVPYCHTGCPVNNQIPDWNDLVYRDKWRTASANLHSTNNFPEITGRICPAPCEASCTLNLDDQPVTIKTIECAIADRSFEQGWIKPMVPAAKSGRKVAIVGSGPAGLAAAQQLARAGHDVHVYEKNAKPGGLLRYGIPDFKMEKYIIDRRIDQMKAEGVTFHCNSYITADNSDSNSSGDITIECAIADHSFEQGWIKPMMPAAKSGRKVAIVGSGPAGLAAAQQLARAGHDVHVYEKNAKPGGLLRYGIPDFKMEKYIIDRRIDQMKAEGVTFHCNSYITADNSDSNSSGATNIAVADLEKQYDALLLTGGSEQPRDLEVPGRELMGIHFAMDFLPQQNRRVSGEPLSQGVHGLGTDELATGRHVVVIGGGDTGSDCIGTSIRQGAKSVTQIEIMPQPPEHENKELTWPNWPMKLRTSTSQEEGATRDFAVLTKSFSGENGRVTKLNCVRVDENFKEIPGSEFEIQADLVLLAMGFTNPVHEGMLDALGLDYDRRGNVKADDKRYLTNKRRVFVAGDMRRGQSLVVWAIREGRQAAHAVDKELMGQSNLPR